MTAPHRAPLTIVTGPPGAGKTTVCRILAARAERGLLLDSDLFYAFPARPVDPSLPEAHAQNVAVVRALGAAAGAFLEGGYAVVLDGIVGPWFLDTLRGALPSGWPVDYAVLDVALDVALRRVRERDGAGPSAVVERMHAAFRDLGGLARHRIDAVDARPEQIADRLTALFAAQRLRLP